MAPRLAEETEVRPKPMVEIGGMPMLWHIMKIYAHYGISDFAVALGYKGGIHQGVVPRLCQLWRVDDGEHRHRRRGAPWVRHPRLER